jgi:hypothetical protein
MAKIDAFFKLMNEQGASDLHLIAGQPPALRIRGDIERVKYKVLDSDDLRSMLYEISPGFTKFLLSTRSKNLRNREISILPMKSRAWPDIVPIFLCREMAWELSSERFRAPS